MKTMIVIAALVLLAGCVVLPVERYGHDHRGGHHDYYRGYPHDGYRR